MQRCPCSVGCPLAVYSGRGKTVAYAYEPAVYRICWPRKTDGMHGQHPHRGFETITIAFQGEVEHGDSVGNHDVIGPGDVQWMTAARGIIHEEYHSDKFTAKVRACAFVCVSSDALHQHVGVVWMHGVVAGWNV